MGDLHRSLGISGYRCRGDLSSTPLHRSWVTSAQKQEARPSMKRAEPLAQPMEMRHLPPVSGQGVPTCSTISFQDPPWRPRGTQDVACSYLGHGQVHQGAALRRARPLSFPLGPLRTLLRRQSQYRSPILLAALTALFVAMSAAYLRSMVGSFHPWMVITSSPLIPAVSMSSVAVCLNW